MSGLPAAVVFDWDSTLVDNWGSFTIVMNATYAHFGMPGRTQEEYRKVAARSAREVFPAIFGDRADEARDVFYAAFTRHHLDAITTMPGATELLAHLQERGVTLAVVSNKMGDFLRREADYLGWEARFHRLIGANDTARDKPAPAPMIAALEGTGQTPGETVWYVGDTALDMEFAHNTGCRPILVNAERRAAAEFVDHPPAVIVENCHQLISYLGA